jgi:hypothetical protein
MPRFTFDRIHLRDSMVFTEWDYRGTDPRMLFRDVRRSIQEVTSGGEFKYDTHEPEGPNPRVSADPVGDQPGRVNGRLMATTPWKQFYTGEIVGEESNTLPILLGVIGALALLLGMSDGNDSLLGIGALMLAGGAAWYYFSDAPTRRRTFYYRKNARLLFEGEAATVDRSDNAPVLESSHLTVACGERLEVKMDRGEDANATVPISELPTDVRDQLEAKYTPLEEEIDFSLGNANRYAHRSTERL